MSEESILILNMLREGKITAEQADGLLRAVRSTPPPPPAPPPPPPAPAVDAATLAQMQNKLGDLQGKLGDLQGRLGAEQALRAAGHAKSFMGKALGHLPKSDLDFSKINKSVDEALRGLNSLKNDAVRTAKVAARQAGQEARRAARQGRKVMDDLGFQGVGDDTVIKRPTNSLGKPETTEMAESAVTWSGAGSLSLANPYGNITVTGRDTEDSTAQATLQKTAWAETDAEARVLLQQVFLTSRVENGKCRIEVVAPIDARDKISVDYTLSIPRRLPIEIETRFGDIVAEEVSAQLTVETESGHVIARRPFETQAGEASLAGRSGAVQIDGWNTPQTAVTVKTASGDVAADAVSCRTLSLCSRSGDVRAGKMQTIAEASLEAVSGDVELTGGGVGTRLVVKTQSGDATVTDVRAEQMQIETVSGDAQVQSVAGALTVKTVSGDIDGEGIASTSAAIGTVSGAAHWAFAAPFSGSLAATSVSGDVHVELWSNSDTRLELSTTSGEVSCRLPLSDGSVPRDKSLTGRLGEGTGSIKLQSVSGDLTLDEQK